MTSSSFFSFPDFFQPLISQLHLCYSTLLALLQRHASVKYTDNLPQETYLFWSTVCDLKSTSVYYSPPLLDILQLAPTEFELCMFMLRPDPYLLGLTGSDTPINGMTLDLGFLSSFADGPTFWTFEPTTFILDKKCNTRNSTYSTIIKTVTVLLSWAVCLLFRWTGPVFQRSNFRAP